MAQNLDQPMVYENGTFALASNWVEYSDTVGNASITVAPCYSCNHWPCSCSTYYVNYTPHFWNPYTKIRLTIDDVNKLRTAGRKDAKLKAILQKLTPAIEVEVNLGDV